MATLIFERYESVQLLDQLSPANAELLAAAILDNTLNFQAKITKQRDHDAYIKLLKIAGLAEDFAAQYFQACQTFIMGNLAYALNNDAKIEHHDYALPSIFSQLVVFDVSGVMNQINLVRKTLNTFGSHWMLNLISLSDGHSYVLTSDSSVTTEVQRLFGGKADGNIITLDHVWLRKGLVTQRNDETRLRGFRSERGYERLKNSVNYWFSHFTYFNILEFNFALDFNFIRKSFIMCRY